jgi:hypothetical protein
MLDGHGLLMEVKCVAAVFLKLQHPFISMECNPCAVVIRRRNANLPVKRRSQNEVRRDRECNRRGRYSMLL